MDENNINNNENFTEEETNIVNQNNTTEKENINQESTSPSDDVEENESPQPTSKSHAVKTSSVFKIIAYVILLAGVVVLYILHYSNNNTEKLTNIIESSKNSIMLTVNNDSIVKYFTLAEQLKKDLETEATKYQTELASKQSVLQEKYKNYQINLQKNILTQTQIQNAEKQLQQEAADLQSLQENYSQILASKEESVHKEITDSIVNATRRVNDNKYKADYVIATSTGSAILYANKVYDITDEVIKELNDAYKKSSK